MGPQRGVIFPRGVKDAFQAAEHLRKFDFVDKERVALAGYSWGAMVATLASSQRWASVFGTGPRFAAAVAFYPGCFTIKLPTTPPYEIVNPDIDRPLLVLMGGKDTETPASECTSRLDPMKASGAPVETHLYPDATHCWDCRQLHNVAKTDVRGNQVVYHYDKNVTGDSGRECSSSWTKRCSADRGSAPPTRLTQGLFRHFRAAPTSAAE
jgi:dienelactone hydrolase